MDHLSERALVLNRSWRAITTASVRRAICLMYADAAHAICAQSYETFDFEAWLNKPIRDDESVLRGVGCEIPVPEIIVLRGYDAMPKRTVAFSRRNLYRRDQYTCHYCGCRPGTDTLTIDHVLPRSRGGRTSWENCVLACEDCNKKKGNRLISNSDMRLLRQPRVPEWSWDVELSAGGHCDSWEHFLPRRKKRASVG